MKVTAPPRQTARRGLITSPELVAVLADFDVFTTATIVETPDGAR